MYATATVLTVCREHYCYPVTDPAISRKPTYGYVSRGPCSQIQGASCSKTTFKLTSSMPVHARAAICDHIDHGFVAASLPLVIAQYKASEEMLFGTLPADLEISQAGIRDFAELLPGVESRSVERCDKLDQCKLGGLKECFMNGLETGSERKCRVTKDYQAEFLDPIAVEAGEAFTGSERNSVWENNPAWIWVWCTDLLAPRKESRVFQIQVDADCIR